MIINAEILLNSAKIHTTRFSRSCDVKYIGIVPFHADWEADVNEYPYWQHLKHMRKVKIGLIARIFFDFGEIRFYRF